MAGWRTLPEGPLRARDGRDPAVESFVRADPRFDEFFRRVSELLLFLLPAHLEEGRSHVSIAFGCTGGQHRSVAVAEMMADTLAQSGWAVSKRHRELERRNGVDPLATGPQATKVDGV